MEQGEQGLLLDAGSPKFAELLRGLRTNLIMAPEFAAGRTLLVTSSEPGEGKTMTAANIAASLARLNQRVLLIDGDLRRPRLHEMFGETQEPGLTDVLSGKITGAVTATAFRKTSVSRLWLMPAGHASRNPADLIGSDRFGKLMTALEAQFDWVVLDSPPVMAVTDPCLIARATSAVLFVVGQGQTSREVATAAVNQLDAAGAHLIGVVLNRVTLDKPGESYLPYYHREFQSYYSPHDGSGWRPQLPDGQSPASKDRAQAS
jgi:capsular exopolysaccharide synthesis family protein